MKDLQSKKSCPLSYMDYPCHFYKEILIPSSMIFQIPTPL